MNLIKLKKEQLMLLGSNIYDIKKEINFNKVEDMISDLHELYSNFDKDKVDFENYELNKLMSEISVAKFNGHFTEKHFKVLITRQIDLTRELFKNKTEEK